MNLRNRLALAAAGAAALAVIAVAILGVTFARYELRSEVDDSLTRQANNVDAAEVVAQQSPDDDRDGDGGRGPRGDGGGPKADRKSVV